MGRGTWAKLPGGVIIKGKTASEVAKKVEKALRNYSKSRKPRTLTAQDKAILKKHGGNFPPRMATKKEMEDIAKWSKKNVKGLRVVK